MIFMNDSHAERWAEAVEAAGALRNDDTVNTYFGASLLILTGVPHLYGRVKRHIYSSWIDFEAILEMGLSTGERILVALAGNLYNDGFFDRYTPIDIINHCDSDMLELATRAMRIRQQRIDINTIFG